MKKTEKIAIIISAVVLSTSFFSATASAYSLDDAVSYAHTFWHYRSLDYKSVKYNCANYVSQCLVASGRPMTSEWENDIHFPFFMWTFTESFTKCTEQKKYLERKGWASEKGKYFASKNPENYPSNPLIGPGNIIYYDWDGSGSVDHASFVTDVLLSGTSPVATICQNTTDRYQATWHLRDYLDDNQKRKCVYTIMKVKY